jgi:hypothetical protein
MHSDWVVTLLVGVCVVSIQSSSLYRKLAVLSSRLRRLASSEIVARGDSIPVRRSGMSRVVLGGFSLLALVGAMACGGGGSNSPTSPTGTPQGQEGTVALGGSWTGTLSRPNGLASIAVRWEATQATTGNESHLRGPMTLTNGAASVTLAMDAVLGGNDSSGYNVRFNWGASTAGACSIVTDGSTSAESTSRIRGPFRAGTTITTGTFSLLYGNCQGFIEPDEQRTGHTETTQLSVTKQ